MSTQILQSALTGILEAAVNNALKMDPGTLHRLAELDGKAFRISCTFPSLSLILIPHTQGIMLQPYHDQSADSHIRGDASALLHLMTADNKTDALFNSSIELRGDIEAAQNLQNIMADLDIDWEEKLSQWVGDIAAHQIGNQARSLFKWGARALDSMLMNTEEYLHEEARSIPPNLELDNFYQEITQLTLDTDRLAARLERLVESVASPKTTSPKTTSPKTNKAKKESRT